MRSGCIDSPSARIAPIARRRFPDGRGAISCRTDQPRRADPSAEAARLGISLNEGLAAGTISTAAKQPLAINPNLTDSAGKHSQWMIDNDLFSHYEGATGPQQRMSAAGYSFSGSWTSGENIAWRGQFPTSPTSPARPRRFTTICSSIPPSPGAGIA